MADKAVCECTKTRRDVRKLRWPNEVRNRTKKKRLPTMADKAVPGWA